MASTSSFSRSPTPDYYPVQPDHFYPNGQPSQTLNDGKFAFLSPDQDPLCLRGIPVFRPTMEEFQDFESYVERVDVWGRKSGIVKIIPPKEWTDSLPSTVPLLPKIKIKQPIEQHMVGRAGLFRQQNVEKRKAFSVRDWVTLCNKEEFKAPSGDKPARGERPGRSKRGQRGAVVEAVKEEEKAQGEGSPREEGDDRSTRKTTPSLDLSELSAEDAAFYSEFDPHTSWLPPNTKLTDYTPEFCRNLERTFWRTCGFGAPPMYGADMQGSLFGPETTAWNVSCLPSVLTRLNLKRQLPGVNTPYLYFGMWRATFAWHVEDMDLYSINYIHWGAPKQWYAVPSERSKAFEGVMQGYFPSGKTSCSQFLRHKSYLASPTILTNSSCRPNVLVQQQGEFVITFPRGYHAGYNMGVNCAESVNFALESWIPIGRLARVCECVGDSVRIDIDALLAESAENEEKDQQRQLKQQKKRKSSVLSSEKDSSPSTRGESPAPAKRPKTKKTSLMGSATGAHIERKLVLKPPRPPPGHPSSFPCCLCPSTATDGLLPTVSPPPSWTGAQSEANVEVWRAHEACANAVPETWVEEIEGKKWVLGVDTIVKDRWNLKCTVCTKTAFKKHGAKVQCTKGKCARAFHVSCAIDSADVVYREVEAADREVFVVDGVSTLTKPFDALPEADQPGAQSASTGGTVETVDGDQAGAANTAPLEAGWMVIRSEDVEHSANDVKDARNGVDGTASLNEPRSAMQPTWHIPTPPSDPGSSSLPESRRVRKVTVEILCPQHNPTLLGAKKAEKLDKLRNDLLALPPMSRIRLKLSAGVFEVTLVKIDEASGCVDVMWDNGGVRTFKWSSIVWGRTEGFNAMKDAVLQPQPGTRILPELLAFYN
ncbi:hypothetical protein BOTBODRAFT_125491 [Botryobasidium botryosum FD-172 SS1]|uniref:[histone H3]-trimethyl-L-lysine(9) demethylase n=1 Tax=Botryobasidium botryosum (strain FD-172 SS1) TaxID=930990 RepID=A0A067N866_BOTB1|nr:hypothetical protein BOTBODRAFT_125491 [Botryobasidium botryosum FD-172 SS1]